MSHGNDNLLALPRALPEAETCPSSGAFDAFACDERAELLRYLRGHLPTDADAQDAAQESVLRLLRYRAHPADAWRPLLYRIAGNVVAEFYRRGAARRSNQHVPLDSVEPPSDALELEERAERRQRKARLRDAILALPPRSRQIYLLSRVDRLTYAQIAQRCGISTKAVEVSISRTLAVLARSVGGGDRRAS
jgi:RNA polymerase sigma-70 factor (ECF subfamily)